MRSYKIQFVQLYDDDYDRRVEMADTLLPILQNPGNKDRIFFSDECTFYLSEMVHKQNCRKWGYENQHEVQEVPLHSLKVNVWCAMSSKCIIGPYFFDDKNVNSENYLEMLKEYFHPILVKKALCS